MSDSQTPPHKTADLIGHEAAEKALLDALGGGRLHHAWMITGPRGIGKATLAYRFARYILAHPPEQAAGDGGAGGDLNLFGDPPPPPTSLYLPPDHAVFRRMAAGSEGDLMTVTYGTMPDGRPRTELVIEDVRALSDFFTKTSSGGGWRVAVIDSADALNRNAANALLKVLEEPPARALILLVAHAPGRVLPTILSRCRRLTLRPLSQPSVEAFIAGRHPDMAAEDRALIAALADGSPGMAVALADHDGVALYRRLLHFMARLPDLDPRAVSQLAEDLARRGGEEAFRLFSGLVGDMLGRIAQSASGAGAAAVPIALEEAEAVQRLGRMGSLDRWIEVWEKSTGALQRADALNLDRRQVVIGLLHDVAAATRP